LSEFASVVKPRRLRFFPPPRFKIRSFVLEELTWKKELHAKKLVDVKRTSDMSPETVEHLITIETIRVCIVEVNDESVEDAPYEELNDWPHTLMNFVTIAFHDVNSSSDLEEIENFRRAAEEAV
jgi:hypothetical protein